MPDPASDPAPEDPDPESMRRSTHEAYRLAFHVPDDWRDQLSEADLNELSDLVVWRRR
jgi:hypothetical protein